MNEKYLPALRKVALLGGMSGYVAISSRELGEALGMSQQSASKRILELLEEGFIERDLGARRQRIRLTEKGIEELRREYAEYRRIFEMTDHVILHGTITTGMGEGGYYICQSPYMEQFINQLNFKPYEGTLNIKLDKEDVGKLDIIRDSPGYKIKGFSKEGRTFGEVTAYKAKIRNIDCAVVIPERSHYDDVIEVLCQYHLRRTLSITDGDRVEVRVEI
ncbi:MAG TPA: DUF120 domain-containing protein [Candidatus Methanomethylophilaceae archaeon]|nr:DUF120 domain-containing protein [Candidatus Methanomethylophilaceae archaeon]